MPLLLRISFLLITLFVLRQADKEVIGDYESLRSIENVNTDWEYIENNTNNLNELSDEDPWIKVNIPHTWNQWDATDIVPGYRRDASWYKKTIEINNADDKLYKLYFEGSNITTDVYVNRQKAGRHIGGYVGFEIDITPYLNKNGENEILVRVDNSYDPNVIPSQKADFIIYGGITRDLWLRSVPKVNIKKLHVSTPTVSETSAEAVINVLLENNTDCENCQILATVSKQGSDKVLSTSNLEVSSENNTYDLVMTSIDNPNLWSPDSPELYEITAQLIEKGQVKDQVKETFGFRWYHFEENGAFFLNGKKLLLRGTHRHEEHAGYGSAMPNKLHRKDIKMIKDIGANFLRLGHYPQDPEVYKACDELGIIVWDEVPWCRGGVGGDVWKENTKRLLEEQINQNFNHPSILFWSLGNEVYWLPDFEDGGNSEKINDFLTEMHALAHELDENRLTAIRKYYDGADLVDVFSPSIWSGWYAGVYTNYGPTLVKNQKKYPRFLHMEYGGSSHVGRHTENPITGSGTINDDDWEEVSNQVDIKNIAKEGDWTENYIVDLFDWYLSITEQMDDFAGNAQWAFKDFATPLRPENAIPYMNQKGLVDRNGNPKDAYYVYKSYWTEEPMVYIESHTWTERQGPKGKKRDVAVFSNADRVELFLNGKSGGVKNRDMQSFPACGLNWSLEFSEGTNKLLAIAYRDNSEVARDSMVLNYSYTKADKADRIGLTYSPLANGNILIEATMLDKNGVRVLDYEDKVYFSLDGKGKLLVNYGTPTRSQVIEMANGSARIEMVPENGRAIIEARNQEFKGSYLVIDSGSKDLGDSSEK